MSTESFDKTFRLEDEAAVTRFLEIMQEDVKIPLSSYTSAKDELRRHEKSVDLLVSRLKNS